MKFLGNQTSDDRFNLGQPDDELLHILGVADRCLAMGAFI